MRKELELIEKIDRFFNKELSLEEMKSFQDEIDNNPILKKQVENQSLLQEGIQSMSLKEQAQIAYKKYQLFKLLKYIGIPMGIVTIAIVIWSLSKNQNQNLVNTKTNDSIQNQVDTKITPLLSDSTQKDQPVPALKPDTIVKDKTKPIISLPDIIIEAEDYVNFNDISPENLGKSYRKDAVDIYKSGDAFVVGHTFPNEWLEYTFDIEQKGNYELIIKVCSGQDSVDRKIDFKINNKLWKTVNTPFTGSWLSYQDMSCGSYQFEKGKKQKLKLEFSTGWINLDKIILRYSNK